VGNNWSFDPFKKIRSIPEFGSPIFPCSDPTFPLCHARHKQFVLDDPLPITKWTSIEHPDRPVPIRKKEVVCLKPAFEKDFDLYLRSILWETSPFPQSLDHIQDPHDPMKRTESVGS